MSRGEDLSIRNEDSWKRWGPRSFALVCLALQCGCAGLGPYVWVDDAPPLDVEESGYVIAAGDLLNVRVYNQEGMSARVRVRSDGKVSLPFLNEVDAAGFNPGALAVQLQTRLKDFVNLPVVTVSIEETRPSTISVMGEVARPGMFSLEATPGVLQALASAGGLTELAHPDRVFLLRQAEQKEGGPKLLRIRFSFIALSRGLGRGASLRLRRGDVIVVE
jgi:polysaccharide export outer membrane protein